MDWQSCLLWLTAVVVQWLTDVFVQVYDAAADQTTLTLTLAAADTSMSTLDSVSLRVTQSALSSQPETSAAHESGLRMSEQQTSLHSRCDNNGLQSSVEWRQVTMVAGNATIQVGSCLFCATPPCNAVYPVHHSAQHAAAILATECAAAA